MKEDDQSDDGDGRISLSSAEIAAPPEFRPSLAFLHLPSFTEILHLPTSILHQAATSAEHHECESHLNAELTSGE